MITSKKNPPRRAGWKGQLLLRLIEHDPDEPPRDRSGNGVYWAGFLMLAAVWIITALLGSVNWTNVALGVWTGISLAVWAIDVTGNRVPKWMRR